MAAEPITISMPDGETVSGLWQAPPGARPAWCWRTAPGRA
jgi:hypothetical protein